MYKKINRKEITNEVIDFCFKYGVFKKPVRLDEIRRIESGLNDSAFVEEVIGMITEKIKTHKKVDYAKVSQLYVKLNILRFELECSSVQK